MTQHRATLRPMTSVANVEKLLQDGPIVLFDGVCNLCNGAVRFLLDRDRRAVLRFAALQSEVGRGLLGALGVELGEEGDPGTVYLIEKGHLYQRSTAALRVTRYLTGLWPAASGLLVVPRFVRDAIYDLIASRRYRWFGRSDACRIPTPEEAARFYG